LSNPLFKLANDSVTGTKLLQSAAVIQVEGIASQKL
jgi:hypothetical protein